MPAGPPLGREPGNAGGVGPGPGGALLGSGKRGAAPGTAASCCALSHSVSVCVAAHLCPVPCAGQASQTAGQDGNKIKDLPTDVHLQTVVGARTGRGESGGPPEAATGPKGEEPSGDGDQGQGQRRGGLGPLRGQKDQWGRDLGKVVGAEIRRWAGA